MATYALTIAGVSKQIQDGWSISETANGRNTFNFVVLSRDGTYIPALHAEVLFTEDGVRIFGGNIDQPASIGGAGHGGAEMTTTCSAVDFNALADRRVLTAVVIPAGTLKAALQVIEPYPTPYGVALDAGQVAGPAIPELTLGYSRADEVLNQLSVLSGGYIWEIDYNKTLRMFLPGTTAAPFNVIDGDGNAIGEVVIEPSRTKYANKVYVLGGGEVPYVASASDGGPASLLVEDVVRYNDVLDPTVLDALAVQELARRLLQPRVATYTTLRTGLKPGMTQTLTIPSHSISAVTFLIVAIETRGESANQVTRTLTLIEGTLNGPGWGEVYKKWSGGGTGTGTILVGSGGPTIAVGTTPLGGARNSGIAKSPAAWTPVLNYILYTAPASYGGRVRAQAWARNGGVSVTVRLYDVTAAAVVATSSAITATIETDITPILVGLTLGHAYRLEMLSSVNNEEVRAIGTLEHA